MKIFGAFVALGTIAGTLSAWHDSPVRAGGEQFIIRILVDDEDGQVVASFRYAGPPGAPAYYATEEICEAAVNADTTFKTSLEDLRKVAEAHVGPHAQLEVYCAEDPEL